MHTSPSHAAKRSSPLWWRKHAYAVRLLSCFSTVTLATIYVRFFERSGPEVNLIWVATGVLLTHLLLAPRWRWPGYLLAGTAGMTFGSALIGEPWQTNLLYNVLNLIEVSVGALLLRPKSTQLPQFTNRKYLLRFVGYAVLAGPLTAGAILTLVMATWSHNGHLKTLLDWVIGDGLGTAVIVPTFVAILATRFKNSVSLRRHWPYPLALATVTAASFAQNKMPLFILIFPILVLILMRLGLGWAALATLFVSASASWCSIHNLGPFAISGAMYSVEATLQVQFFVACCTVMIYLVSVILEERDATEFRLQEIASIHSMVTDNSRDVILLADLDGRCTYVSPTIQSINGWQPEDLLSQTLSAHAHPDDRAKIEEAMQQVLHEPKGIILEFRTLQRSGGYVWVESSLRLFRDRKTRIPAGILNLVRDITERKHNEGLLLRAYESLEELATSDPLTGVANRRRFDEYLAVEWSRSARLQKPISLLLIDADNFKLHNDTYGHLSGDRFLKRIAEAAIAAARRPEDLVARFGGDEFAVIMPDTDIQGAAAVATQIVESLRMSPENRSEIPARQVTISIGCGTEICRQGEPPETLIQIADEALYDAKRSGRNQLRNGPVPSLARSVQPTSFSI